jgi:hypothetical protein
MTERGTSLQLKASVNWRAILSNALRLIRGWLKLIFALEARSGYISHINMGYISVFVWDIYPLDVVMKTRISVAARLGRKNVGGYRAKRKCATQRQPPT